MLRATPDTSQEPVMNVMPKTINARYVRIKPWSKGSKSTMYCMRIEIYGYRSGKNFLVKMSLCFLVSSMSSSPVFVFRREAVRFIIYLQYRCIKE